MAAERWSIAIAIDFGTTGTALAITFPADKNKKLHQLLETVTPVKPGDISDQISGDKQPTVLLLDEEEPHGLIAFGRAARTKYAQTDDATGARARASKGLFFKNFKMSLYAGDQRHLMNMMVEPSTEFAVDSRLASAPGAGGSGTTDTAHASRTAVPAVTLVQRTLEYCKAQALEYLASRMRDADKLKKKWVITCPAIWTEEAKSLMRRAAFNAGLIEYENSDNLMIVLEPEAAILASLSDCAPALVDLPAGDPGSPADGASAGAKKGGAAAALDGEASSRYGSLFKVGTTVLVADCGGGTVDYTVEQVVKAADPGPLALKELCAPSGGSWGAVNVDVNFSNFMKELLGNERFEALDTLVKLELLTAWETEKLTVGGVDEEKDTISLKVADLIESLDQNLDDGFTKGDMKELVEEYNKKHKKHYQKLKEEQQKLANGAAAGAGEGTPTSGSGGSAGAKGGDDGDSDEEDEPVTWLPKGQKIRISPVVTRSFFAPVINAIVGHTATLLKEKLPGGKADVVLVAGGFAQSPMLQRSMKQAFENEHTAVILPRRPGQAVVLGAALFALMPSAITERVMKYSWGFLAQETYDPAIHEPIHKKRQHGKDTVSIVLPAVQIGQTVKVGHVFKQTLYASTPQQKYMEFRLFRVSERIHDPFDNEIWDKRTVAVKDKHPYQEWVHKDTREVSTVDDLAATISIRIGSRGLPAADRTVDLEIHFGEAEIEAKAISHLTKKEQKLLITYGAVSSFFSFFTYVVLCCFLVFPIINSFFVSSCYLFCSLVRSAGPPLVLWRPRSALLPMRTTKTVITRTLTMTTLMTTMRMAARAARPSLRPAATPSKQPGSLQPDGAKVKRRQSLPFSRRFLLFATGSIIVRLFLLLGFPLTVLKLEEASS
jgi:molecular chaperone DnaK (HSP70)